MSYVDNSHIQCDWCKAKNFETDQQVLAYTSDWTWREGECLCGDCSRAKANAAADVKKQRSR